LQVGGQCLNGKEQNLKAGGAGDGIKGKNDFDNGPNLKGDRKIGQIT
jgi:hypothetical protein